MATCIDLEDDVTCCICVELFADPVMLPCMHTLCNKCALQIRGRSGRSSVIQCPLCQANCKYSQLRKDFNKSKLVDIYKKAADLTLTQELGAVLQDVKYCGFCNDSQLSWKCVDCDMFLCEKCKIGHSKLPVCKNHTLQKIDYTAPTSSIEKLKVFEQTLLSLKEKCEVNYGSMEDYLGSITSQMEELSSNLSDAEDDLIKNIRSRFKQETDKGVDALATEEDIMASYCTDLRRKQNELAETLTVIKNVIREHTGEGATNPDDPFLLDVLNQAENVHNELLSALSTLAVPSEKLRVKFAPRDFSNVVNSIKVCVERTPCEENPPSVPARPIGAVPRSSASSCTPSSTVLSSVERSSASSSTSSPSAAPVSAAIASAFRMCDQTVSPKATNTPGTQPTETLVVSPKQRSQNPLSKQPLPPPRPPPPYSVAIASFTPTSNTQAAPTSPISLSTPVPTSSIFSTKLRRSGRKSNRRTVSEPRNKSANREPRRCETSPVELGATAFNFPAPEGVSSARTAESTPKTSGSAVPKNSSKDQLAANQSLLIDAPIPETPRPDIPLFFIGTPNLSSFLDKRLIKNSIYMCQKRPSRIHSIEDNIWIVLEDGSITVLNMNGNFIRNIWVHMSVHGSQGDGSFPFSTSAVTAAANGDIIAACTGISAEMKDTRQIPLQPGLCIINSDGQCLHVISNDPFLDVSKGTEVIHGLRKTDRNVIEYRFRDNNWVVLRKIELVPTTQYTRLVSHGEFLYASSVLPDLIHKVRLQSCRIKTLGFRGSGLPGELRSPRVSCADEHGVVLVTDYWNNRVQVFTVENSFHILNIEDGIAGPQDAVLDERTGTLLVLSYVDRNLYRVHAAVSST